MGLVGRVTAALTVALLAKIAVYVDSFATAAAILLAAIYSETHSATASLVYGVVIWLVCQAIIIVAFVGIVTICRRFRPRPEQSPE